MTVIEKHWSKPIRVFFKCLIALFLHLVLFYLIFFSTNTSLLKSRYDFVTQDVLLRTSDQSVTPSINYTVVTRSPYDAYRGLNNNTITYVRNTVGCAINSYYVNSDVLAVLQSPNFATYQAFGILIAIINLFLVCFTLAKLDFAKALQSCEFDDNVYAPLYSWLIANLCISSLTSMTYLLYGGLFSLTLDPCVTWSRYPSLTYIFKQEITSFLFRFVWAYVGLLICYVLVFYVVLRPKAKMHRYFYGMLLVLYLGSVGGRGLGSYDGSKEAVMGVCG
jgi:hypothetical protein